MLKWKSQPPDTAPDILAFQRNGQMVKRPLVRVSDMGSVHQTGQYFHLEANSSFQVTVPASWKIRETWLSEGISTYTFTPPEKHGNGEGR